MIQSETYNHYIKQRQSFHTHSKLWDMIFKSWHHFLQEVCACNIFTSSVRFSLQKLWYRIKLSTSTKQPKGECEVIIIMQDLYSTYTRKEHALNTCDKMIEGLVCKSKNNLYHLWQLKVTIDTTDYRLTDDFKHVSKQ